MAIKARQTKDGIVQFRIPGHAKVVLQTYADQQGLTLSDLARRTLESLVKVIQQQKH